jgi:hypothetical protein
MVRRGVGNPLGRPPSEGLRCGPSWVWSCCFVVPASVSSRHRGEGGRPARNGPSTTVVSVTLHEHRTRFEDGGRSENDYDVVSGSFVVGRNLPAERWRSEGTTVEMVDLH